MNKFKLLIGILLVFVLGVLAGSFGMGMFIQHRFEKFVFDGPGPGRPHHPPMMRFVMRKLDRELELTNDQRHKIEEMMNQTFEEIHSIMRERHPEMEELVQANLERIKGILNLEQKEKMEGLKLFEKMKERFHRKHTFRRDSEMPKSGEILGDLIERLQVNETQEKEIQPIIKDSIVMQRKIVDAYRRQERSKRRAMKNEIDELQEDTKEKLEKILTEDQMKLFLDMQEEQGMHMRGGMRRPGIP